MSPRAGGHRDAFSLLLEAARNVNSKYLQVICTHVCGTYMMHSSAMKAISQIWRRACEWRSLGFTKPHGSDHWCVTGADLGIYDILLSPSSLISCI